jgi:hypothetical protein
LAGPLILTGWEALLLMTILLKTDLQPKVVGFAGMQTMENNSMRLCGDSHQSRTLGDGVLFFLIQYLVLTLWASKELVFQFYLEYFKTGYCGVVRIMV